MKTIAFVAVALIGFSVPAYPQTTCLNPTPDGGFSVEQGNQARGYLIPDYNGCGNFTVQQPSGRIQGYLRSDGAGGYYFDPLPQMRPRPRK